MTSMEKAVRLQARSLRRRELLSDLALELARGERDDADFDDLFNESVFYLIEAILQIVLQCEDPKAAVSRVIEMLGKARLDEPVENPTV